jgi:predicted nucleic acid-binding protein
MKLLVVDASAIVELLLGTPRGRTMGPSLTSPELDLHVPSLCDVEVASALRGLVRRRRVGVRRSEAALRDYRNLPITRHGHLMLLDRIFELRDNFSCYDAAYVALAETLDAALGSGDERLIGAVSAYTEVRLEEWKGDLNGTP